MGDNDYELQRAIVRSWLSDGNYAATKGLVEAYYAGCGLRGVWFDKLAAQTPPEEIGKKDLSAVRALSVGFPRPFLDHLEQENTRQHIRSVLRQIPVDDRLEDLSCTEFNKLLGPKSVAWGAWHELAECLKKANARAPYVGASKLLAAKRLRLIPLEDSFVRKALKTRRRYIWEAIYHIVRDPGISDGLARIRCDVPAASHLTIHRVLDIIAWNKGQGN